MRAAFRLRFVAVAAAALRPSPSPPIARVSMLRRQAPPLSAASCSGSLPMAAPSPFDPTRGRRAPSGPGAPKRLGSGAPNLASKRRRKIEASGRVYPDDDAELGGNREDHLSPDMRDRKGARSAAVGRRGLVNDGNACYQNAVLQCLNAVPQLARHLLGDDDDDDDDGDVDRDEDGGARRQQRWLADAVVSPALAKLFRSLRSFDGSSSAVSGRRIAAAMSDSGRWDPSDRSRDWWPGGGQQDAHEFFTAVVQALRDESTTSGVEQRSAVDDVFGMRLACENVCRACGHMSCRSEYATEIQVAVPSHEDRSASPVKVSDCVAALADAETLEDYRCDGCGAIGSTDRRSFVERFPKVLLVTVKRFRHSYDPSTGSFRATKSSVALDVGDEGMLDVGKLAETQGSSKIPPKYGLLAAANHVGGLGFGHYTAVVKVRNGDGEGFWSFDDSRVTRVKDLALSCRDAYLLLYQLEEREGGEMNKEVEE